MLRGRGCLSLMKCVSRCLTHSDVVMLTPTTCIVCIAVRDVCTWIDSIGLGQYRKKFLHNLVDGYILFSLNDEMLKQEIGIGPLGHRVMLLRSIDALERDGSGGGGGGGRGPGGGRFSSPATAHSRPSSTTPYQQSPTSRSPAQEYPRRPASASPSVIPSDRYLGPAAGKVRRLSLSFLASLENETCAGTSIAYRIAAIMSQQASTPLVSSSPPIRSCASGDRVRATLQAAV